MLKMDQVHVLRHQVLNEGRSIRRGARELGISRNTVAKYLEQSEPVRRHGRPRGRPVWEGAATAGGTNSGVGATKRPRASSLSEASR
jgi:transposase-like protein